MEQETKMQLRELSNRKVQLHLQLEGIELNRGNFDAKKLKVQMQIEEGKGQADCNEKEREVMQKLQQVSSTTEGKTGLLFIVHSLEFGGAV